MAVIGVGVAGVLAAAAAGGGGGGDTAIDDGVPPGRPMLMPLDVLSVQGYEDLLVAVERTAGSTEAFEAVIHPESAVLHLPADGTSARHSSWYWDGEMEALAPKEALPAESFALDDVDPRVLLELLRRARSLVDSPASQYVILRPPDADGAAIWAYARNEYTQSGYISATLRGRVVRNTFTE